MNSNPKYSFGQTVHKAWASAHTCVRVKCDICFGHRSVTLILGDGTTQPVECSACQHGIAGPIGMVNQYEPSYGTSEYVITGLRHENEKWLYVSGHETLKEEELFVEKSEAMTHARDVLYPVALAWAKKATESNYLQHKKKLAWSAQYHRKKIAELRRQITWHEEKLADKRVKNDVGA